METIVFTDQSWGLPEVCFASKVMKPLKKCRISLSVWKFARGVAVAHGVTVTRGYKLAYTIHIRCIYFTYIHICPNLGTGLNWKSCPKGSYSNLTGLSKESQCQPCDGGYYCDMPRSTKPKAVCFGGYYCESGVDRPDPIHSGNFSSSWPNNCSIFGHHTGKYCFDTKFSYLWVTYFNGDCIRELF